MMAQKTELTAYTSQKNPPNFKSAILGLVAHPKNVLREYLAAFKNKCQADILSFVDGWIKTNRSRQRPDWVRLSASQVAVNLGYCKKTIATHLKKLVEMGVLVRDTLIKLFACDTAYSYKIDEAVLLGIVGKKDSSSEVNLPLQESKVTTPEEQNYPAYYLSSDKKEINTTTQPVVAPSLCSKYQEPIEPCPVRPQPSVKQVKCQPTAQDHSSIISNERINEVKALGVELKSQSLRCEVINAAAVVYEKAIAVLKEKLAKKDCTNPPGFLRKALSEGYDNAPPLSRREEEFDTAYKQLVAAGISKNVPQRHLNIRNNEPMVCVIDSSEQGYHDEPWRDAMRLL